jgi:riboflavin kinase/FMN adenylyltransferase
MEVLRDVGSCPWPGEASVVTVGAYDGVHLGHRAVVAEVRRRATEAGLHSAVVTFDRHPASVVRPESAPRLLTDLEQKLELLAATGIDACLVVSFDEARSKEPAEEFVTEVLVTALAARQVVVGVDFHFGYQRRGNVELLQSMGAELGFSAVGLDLVDEGGDSAAGTTKVSSTAIRQALVEGELATATRMLGRPYEVRGLVAQGDDELAAAGVPTVDVSVPGDILVPASGTYLVGVGSRPDGPGAVVSIGRRPPLHAEANVHLVEVHGMSDALAGDHVAMRFVQRLGAPGPADPAAAASHLGPLLPRSG